jgi:hypothetical protein
MRGTARAGVYFGASLMLAAHKLPCPRYGMLSFSALKIQIIE